MKSKAILFISFIFFLISSHAQVTIYNNFGAAHDGWDYNYGLGWTIAGDSVESQYGVEQAMGFEASGGGFLTDIWVAISYVPSSPYADTVIIRLVENPDGLPPDPAYIMEEWVLTEFDDWYQWNEPIHLAASDTTALVQANHYWLWAIAGDQTWTMWCMNEDPALTCPHTIRREGEEWLSVSDETASAFRVDVSLGIDIDENGKRIYDAKLSQNYPNPFTIYTQIPYHLNKAGHVRLEVMDLTGREILVLVDEYRVAGNYIAYLNNMNFPAGMYFYRISIDGKINDVGKMNYIR